MFSFTRPSPLTIEKQLEDARNLPLSYEIAIDTVAGLTGVHVPSGFSLDHTRSEIGRGHDAFAAARLAFSQWLHFDLGWLRVANPSALIEAGQIVAVEPHSLGLWSVNLSRILYVIHEEHRFGYGYGTTSMHVESGEERFLIEHDPATGKVIYELLAVSHPAHWMALLAYPYTRSQQHRFARDSHAKMKQIATTAMRD